MRRARNRVEPFQMASLSWRYHSLVRAVVPEVSDLLRAHGRDGLERGLLIHSSCIWRWVQIYGPELDKRCRAHLKPTNKSYRVDETYIRIKGSADICTEPWIPPGRPSIFCSRPNAMLRQPNDSFVRCCSTQPIRSLGSSTWTRTERIRRPWRNSRSKAHSGAAADYASANT